MAGENKIIGLKAGLRAFGLLLVFLTGYGAGLFFNNSQIATNNNSSVTGGNLPGNVVENPIVSGTNVDGVLKSKGKDFLVLEKEGKELKIFIEGNLDFIKIPDSSQKVTGSNVMKEKLDDIKTGTNLTGQVVFKKDPKTSEVRIVAVSFLVKT